MGQCRRPGGSAKRPTCETCACKAELPTPAQLREAAQDVVDNVGGVLERWVDVLSGPECDGQLPAHRRCAAYRAAALELGYAQRQKLPPCVQDAIRVLHPDPRNRYTGYESP